LVIPDSYLEVTLEASPESLLVHASLPAVTDPPLFQTKGVVFPYVWPVEPCHGHPCRLTPLPFSLSREKHIEPDQDRIGHTLRERCVAHSAQGAFRLQRPPRRVATESRLCRRFPDFDAASLPRLDEPRSLDPRSRSRTFASHRFSGPDTTCQRLQSTINA